LNKKFLGIALILVLAGIVCEASCVPWVKADTRLSSKSAVSSEFIDFRNGTRVMEIDYGNGTLDVITETFLRKDARLIVFENDTLYPPSATSTSLEKLTGYRSVTRALMTEQQVLLGFTYNIAYLRKEWNATGGWWIFKWNFTTGVTLDIRFGLRLPVNITLEFPEQMMWGENYMIYATLNPVDNPNFDEFLLTFKANVWAEVRVAGFPIPLTYVYGPNIDESQSFQTPLGQNATAPLVPLRLDILKLIRELDPSLDFYIDIIALVFTPYIVLQPAFSSQKITAEATALGDALVVEGESLEWYEPNQTLSFIINAGDYNGNNITDYAKIKLENFRYYFTDFYLNLELEFNFASVINEVLGVQDIIITLFTIDMSWLVEGLYLAAHSGYPGYVYTTIIVYRNIGPPEVIRPRDIALISTEVSPNFVYAGRVVNIMVTVKNLGNETESFNVIVRYDNLTIGEQSVTRLGPAENVTLSFSWDTTGLQEGRIYTIQAEASTVPNEIDVEDNVMVAGSVKIKILGDVNGDDTVNIYDLVEACACYGSSNGDPDWNSEADIASPYGVIDVLDLVTLIYRFG